MRRHAFHYRYDTALELQLLNELYWLVRIRWNMFTATTKAADWRSNRHGKKTRVCDKPRTQTRLIALAEDKTDALTANVSRANPNEAPGHISRAS